MCGKYETDIFSGLVLTSGKKVDVSRHLILKNSTKISQEDMGSHYIYKLKDQETYNIESCKCLNDECLNENNEVYNDEEDKEDEWWRNSNDDEDGEDGDEEYKEDIDEEDEEDSDQEYEEDEDYEDYEDGESHFHIFHTFRRRGQGGRSQG